MRRYFNRTGANDLIPFFVLIGAAVVIIGGLVFADVFFLSTDSNPQDNGILLDEEIVDYGDPVAYMDVSGFGTMKLSLNRAAAPYAVDNFISLCNRGFYDGLTFHRVIEEFMIQGGDPNGDGTGGPGYTIENEADNGLTHVKGALACAKRSDETRMSGSQFYIVHATDGAHHLDGEHTVFGMLLEGFDVLDAIASVQTDANDMPLNTVLVTDCYVVYE